MVSKRFLSILVALSLVVGVTIQAGEIYRYDYQKILKVGNSTQLSFNNNHGDVIITTNNEGRLKIDALKSIYAEDEAGAELISDHIQIRVDSTDGHITIEPYFRPISGRTSSFWEKLFGKAGESSYGSIDFEISVPTDCNADIYNTSGTIDVSGLRGRLLLVGTINDITVRDIQGRVEIRTTSGVINIRDVEGDFHIRANGSDINFFSVVGDLEVRNSTGKTTGEYLIGDVTISQTTGIIELAGVEGDVRAKSTLGNIVVDQRFGALDLATESGDIFVRTDLNSQKDFFIETISGSIDFSIPDATGGKIKMEAISGNIEAGIPISIDDFSKTRISGSFGGGGPKITLSTISGQIKLSQF